MKTIQYKDCSCSEGFITFKSINGKNEQRGPLKLDSTLLLNFTVANYIHEPSLTLESKIKIRKRINWSYINVPFNTIADVVRTLGDENIKHMGYGKFQIDCSFGSCLPTAGENMVEIQIKDIIDRLDNFDNNVENYSGWYEVYIKTITDRGEEVFCAILEFRIDFNA